MLTIKSITGRNIKGRHIDQPLSGVTVFVGDSFSGKTAMLDTIRLALLGYHPKLGKRSIDTIKLCKGTSMMAGVDLSDGRGIRHTWAISKKGSVSYDGLTEPLVPPVLLDAREYFNMSGPQRMAFVFNQIDLKAQGFTDERVYAKLRGLKPEEPNEETEKATTEAVTIAKELAAARDAEDVTIQEWLTEVQSKFTEQKRNADVAMQNMTGLMQGTTQLRGASAQQGQSRENMIADVRATIGRMQGEVAMITDQHTRYQRHVHRIQGLEASLGSTPDHSKRLEELETAIGVLEKENGPGYKSKLPGAVKKLTEAKAAVDKLEKQRDTIEKAQIKSKTDHEALMQHDKCPFCKSSEEGWRDVLTGEYFKQLGELKVQLETTLENLTVARQDVRKAQKEHDAAQAADQKFSKAVDALETLRKERKRLLDESSGREAYAMELKVLKENEPPKGDADKLARLTAELGNAEARLAALDAEQKQWVAARAHEAQVVKARQKQKESEARSMIFKLAIAAVRELQQEMIDTAIGSLMSTANAFVRGILKAELQYRDGDIGYVEAGQWVSHECFSGTEEALAYAGLSVALASNAELKLVMIDELGIMSKAVKRMIVLRMANLVKDGVIAQFVGADVGDDYGDGPLATCVTVVQV